ncbi:hypothetical protein EBU24_04565 [bacterium]|nr:hypothetical protein [bacterium]
MNPIFALMSFVGQRKKLLLSLLSLGFLGCLSAFEEGYKSVLNTLHDLEEQDKKENDDKKKKVSTYCNLCRMECYDLSFFLQHNAIIHAAYQNNSIEIDYTGSQDNPIEIDDSGSQDDQYEFHQKDKFVCRTCKSRFDEKHFLFDHQRFYCKILTKDNKEKRQVLKRKTDNHAEKKTVKKIKPTYSALEKNIAEVLLNMKNSK